MLDWTYVMDDNPIVLPIQWQSRSERIVNLKVTTHLSFLTFSVNVLSSQRNVVSYINTYTETQGERVKVIRTCALSTSKPSRARTPINGRQTAIGEKRQPSPKFKENLSDSSVEWITPEHDSSARK